VIKSAQHTVPSTGSDWWGDYVVETGLTEDRYLKAVETKPPAPRRSCITRSRSCCRTKANRTSSAAGRPRAREPAATRGFLNEYAVGKNGDVFPEGTGRLVKAGAKIRFNMHYHPVGEETVDQTEVALRFYPGLQAEVLHSGVAHGRLRRSRPAAGMDNIRSDGYTRLAQNTRITSFQPHLHNRGKAQCMEAIFPNGKVEQLNCVNNYKFGWHIV